MNTVYVVQHERPQNNGVEDVKLIGVYSSIQTANAAVAKLRLAPGFREYPDAFHVSPYQLDEDHWQEGFVTVD